MKRILSIVLVFILLITSGCSFIGHKKDINGSDPIIPAMVQDSVSGDTETGTKNAENSAADASPSVSSSGASAQSEITELTSGVTSSEILIDNGSGKGLNNNPGNKDIVLITLYYKNKGGLLIPVTRNVAKQEGLAKAAVNGLVDEAATREQLDYYGLYPVLPKGTKIKGMSIKEQVAIIDFSKEFMNFETKNAEEAAVASVVYTLTGFKTISDVNIRVEGREVSQLTNGTSISHMMNRNNTFINSKQTVLNDGYVKVDAYYLAEESEKFNYIVPVSLAIEDNEQMFVSLFSELSKKPSDTKLFTSLPENSKLLSFERKNDMAVLDFSSQINNYGGSEKEDSILNQIYYTIGQIKGINKVKILIDGKESTMAEGTEVASEQTLPLTFNKVIDQ